MISKEEFDNILSQQAKENKNFAREFKIEYLNELMFYYGNHIKSLNSINEAKANWQKCKREGEPTEEYILTTQINRWLCNYKMKSKLQPKQIAKKKVKEDKKIKKNKQLIKQKIKDDKKIKKECIKIAKDPLQSNKIEQEIIIEDKQQIKNAITLLDNININEYSNFWQDSQEYLECVKLKIETINKINLTIIKKDIEINKSIAEQIENLSKEEYNIQSLTEILSKFSNTESLELKLNRQEIESYLSLYSKIIDFQKKPYRDQLSLELTKSNIELNKKRTEEAKVKIEAFNKQVLNKDGGSENKEVDIDIKQKLEILTNVIKNNNYNPELNKEFKEAIKEIN